ncbi:SusC/RagA family TonB-linked outer membrane protein [Bacteroides congonensis]
MKIRTMNYGPCRTLLFASLCLSNVCLSAADGMGLNRSSSAIERCNIVAQAKFKVSGIVKDSKGEPIIGATVTVKNATGGVLTDIDGRFEIEISDKNALLVISYLGFNTAEIKIAGRKFINVEMQEDVQTLSEVVVVGYGTQKKETLTGSIAGIKGESLLKSPSASISNSLAGSIPGISSVQTSGEPGADDAQIFVRGVGSLTESGATPLILVDGVERSFFQMDPNEIESVSVLKDASATAVFGVRGANGVILVTTKRGTEGKTKVSVSSSVGIQTPTRIVDIADSYTHALMKNLKDRNDGVLEENLVFSPYDLERFRLGDEPIMYPNTNWYDYLTKDLAVQTQHNLNISGGTKDVKYFVSLGFLYQDGFFKNFKELNYNSNYRYSRYNYRANMDMNLTKSTVLKLNIGGVVGVKNAPNYHGEFWSMLMATSAPFSSPGVVDGKKVITAPDRFGGLVTQYDMFSRFFGSGYSRQINNTMNFDMVLTQNLDFVTKGLSAEVKGAYNTSYSYYKNVSTQLTTYIPFYYSTVRDPGLEVGDPDFNKEVVYKTTGRDGNLHYGEGDKSRSRDWYFEASLRYQREWNGHNVGVLALYNQTKTYYPEQFTAIPTACVGFAGRMTYDYHSRYLAEFNIGYNGSENFSPDKRYGIFPAGSIGYVLSEESFWKKNDYVTYVKLRASVGSVGNSNMGKNRFLYLPDTYVVDKLNQDSDYKDYLDGYNFGLGNTVIDKGADEKRLGNKAVTWETALKQNYGVDINFFNDKLRVTFDYFTEKRKNILITRSTIPNFTSLTSSILPVVNMGKVNNKGYEVSLKWNDKVKNVAYWVDANMSYAKNKIIYQDEVEPNEPYMWRTGQPVGSIFGYVTERFYTKEDFDADGNLVEGLPKPSSMVHPGDLKYKDLNGDNIINSDDVCKIGYSKRPLYTFGFNYGIEYKGFFASMNWTAAKDASVRLQYSFQTPFEKNHVLYQFIADGSWTEENASTAKYPRLSSSDHNMQSSTTWVQDASYIKLKNATIGYNITNKKILKAIGASLISVKLTGYNLLTFDKLDFMDPEGEPNRAQSYPIMKIYNLGVNITF